MSSEAIAAAVPAPLFGSVCSAFSDAQHHFSSHRKNVHSLLRQHRECSEQGAEGERSFFLAFLHCLHHILNIRKNDELASRLMRFLVGFMVRLAAEKTDAGSRFIENALLYALDNVDAKDKYVRARLCQVVVAGVNAVEEVSDAVWRLLQTGMLCRLYDKEATVRVHAVHAMARLQGLAVISPRTNQKSSILEIFTDILQNDPESEVRRAALAQIDVTDSSLEIVLSRARDAEPSIRRAFFASKMTEIDILVLSIEQRDFILKSGLTDRDESVQKACTDMIFNHWLPRTNSNLIEFMSCLDVVCNGEIAEIALGAFFRVIPKLFDSFPEAYFDHLTVETVFVLRAYCEHIRSIGGIEAVQEMLPELTKMSSTLSRFYEYLVAVGDDEVARAEVEFILGELLAVCGMLDAADEVGRRGCCTVVEEMLVNMNISDSLFEKCCKLLLTFNCSNLDDYCTLMMSISADFKSVFDATESGSSSSSSPSSCVFTDEQTRIMAQLRAVKCLSLVMNASDEVTIARYPVLLALLNELVIPAINSRYAVVQAAGLSCLGLLMLISKDLAKEYQQLFIDFLQVNSGETRSVALQVLFDTSLVHPGLIEELCKNCLPTLCDPDSAAQCTAAEGFSKLLLHDKLPLAESDEVLLGLLTLHHHPMTRDNERLRQCLSFFFHAYSFGSSAHQSRIRGVMCRALVNLVGINGALPISTLFSHLYYLCDPQNLAILEQSPSACRWSPVVCDLLYAAIQLLVSDPSLASKFILCASKIPLAPTPTDDQSNDEDQLCIKEASFLTGLCLKSVPADRHALTALKKLTAALAMSDAGSVVLTLEQQKAVRDKIAALNPGFLARSGNPAHHVSAPPTKGVRRGGGKAIENIMDNLQDILD